MPDIRALVSELQNMPHGSAKVEAARELWNLVCHDSDVSLRFEALCEILEAAMFGGAVDYFFTLIPQLARIKREHPESIDLDDYIWRLKWLVGNMPDYPEISKERIRQAEDEYERELSHAGGSKRTAIYLRWKNAVAMGRLEESEPLRQRFQTMKRDSHADCLACEANTLVSGSIAHDNHVEAEERANEIISGRMRCAQVPHNTFALLALSAELNDEVAKAAMYHKKGYPLVRSNVGFVSQIGQHMSYLAARGENERALRLLKTHAGWLEHNRAPNAHFDFLIGATAVCQALAEKRKRAIKLPLPAKWLAAWGNKPLAPEELAQRFKQEGSALAAAFDLRNENTWHIDTFNQTLARIRERRASRPVAVSQDDRS